MFMRSLFAGFFLFVAGHVSARLVTLDDTDARLLWAPQQVNSSESCSDFICAGSWWVERSIEPAPFNGTEHFTGSPNTTMTFSFRGSQFMLFGSRYSYGGLAHVTVDGQDFGMLNTSIDLNDTFLAPQQNLFTGADLDPSQEHTVKIFYTSSGKEISLVGIDYVIIDETEDTSAMTPVVKGLIGIAAALGTLLLVAVAVIVLYLRRRRGTDSHWDKASIFTSASHEPLSIPRADAVSFVASLEGRVPNRAPTLHAGASTAAMSPRSTRPLSAVSQMPTIRS